MNDAFRTLYWQDETLFLIDQTRLPQEEIYVPCKTADEVGRAIVTMIVRGAPAIGVTAAYGVALSALQHREKNSILTDIEMLGKTRPTAVNLFWALDRMKKLVLQNCKAAELVDEAKRIHAEDIECNKAMGQFGQTLVPHGAKILTHCNAGALATAGYGTALGVIYAAHAAGKKVQVFADETRPFLQGSRLTAWELHKNGVPVTLICDNMAGYLMKKEKFDLVIVGADRIAANGDVANKIGTYSVAILAKEHGIPFYVAAPRSTLDLTLKTGEQIVIEERNTREVTQMGNSVLAPAGISVRNPAFDVTPHHLISAIITEKGIVRPPYTRELASC